MTKIKLPFFYQLFIGILLIHLSSCGVKSGLPFDQVTPPIPPDYSLPSAWAALPERKDSADLVPKGYGTDQQANSKVDVFFLHPTTYTGKFKKDQAWNGDVMDAELSLKTDNSSIKYQATIFNAAGRVYAPRYRQAHLQAYFEKKPDKQVAKAFALAYSDVKKAFEYYLEHYNQGRPIILATHSQGTTHGLQLMKEYFDGKPLQDQLVVAYLVGMPVSKDRFEQIPNCTTPTQTGCICAWQTFKKGYYPDYQPKGNNVLATNPLTWTTEPTYAPKSLNQGGVLRNFDKVFLELADAQVHEGLLWATKPKFPGSFFVWTPRYHIVDYNLYYFNVRNNAVERVEAFLGE